MKHHDLIVQAFGCQTIDLYAAREIGQIAFQCPEGPGYHLCSEAVLCELVDDDGLPVGPGEYGRVVLTSLYNFAMPFIRYDIGDYALSSIGALPVSTPTVRRSIRSGGGRGTSS